MAKTRKNKRVKIDGKTIDLPTGITREKIRNDYKLLVLWKENGKERKKYFPYTITGYAAAKGLNDSKRREKNEYGQTFGAIADDEKRAIDLWRAYRDDCMREGCSFLFMSDVMRKALEKMRPEAITLFFPELASRCLIDMEKNNVSTEHLRKRRHKVEKLSKHFAGVRAGNITPLQIRAFLDTLKGADGGRAKPRTVQDYLVFIGQIFNYGVKNELVQDNPVKRMDKPKVTPEQDPSTLSVQEVRDMLAYAAGDARCRQYLPGLVLAVFCGVRPAELARVRFSDLVLEGRPELYLSRALTKTKIARRAKLRDNVISWLRYTEKQELHAREQDDFVLPGDNEQQRCERYTRCLKRIANGSGIAIPRDSLRHTAGTMISALEGMSMAAEELGNDVRTLANHYRHSVPRCEAEAFFAILPPDLRL